MIHGLIVVNKKKDITSHDVVDIVRKVYGIKKVGHFGTLDPIAQGVLLLGLGNGTFFTDFNTCGRNTFIHFWNKNKKAGHPIPTNHWRTFKFS